MLKRKNKTCITCGENYTFCTGCSEFDHLPRWMAMYHNENCKELFDITTGYLCGHISADEAKDRYEKCDLSYKEKLRDKIQKSIDELLVVNEVATEYCEELNAISDSFEIIQNNDINNDNNDVIDVVKGYLDPVSLDVEKLPVKRRKTSKIKYVKQDDQNLNSDFIWGI